MVWLPSIRLSSPASTLSLQPLSCVQLEPAVADLDLNFVRMRGDAVVELARDQRRQIAPTSKASAKPSASRGAWVVDWVRSDTSMLP